jgi:hypothetical protein
MLSIKATCPQLSQEVFFWNLNERNAGKKGWGAGVGNLLGENWQSHFIMKHLKNNNTHFYFMRILKYHWFDCFIVEVASLVHQDSCCMILFYFRFTIIFVPNSVSLFIFIFSFKNIFFRLVRSLSFRCLVAISLSTPNLRSIILRLFYIGDVSVPRNAADSVSCACHGSNNRYNKGPFTRPIS